MMKLNRYSLFILFALFVSFVFVPKAYADSNPADDTAALTITISPLVDMGVIIDTETVNLAFSLQAGATEFTVTPATVTVDGNLQPQELNIQAFALDDWSLDADENSEANQMQIYALFSVGRSTRPLEGEFEGVSRLLDGSIQRAGGSNGNGVQFENSAMTGAADMDSLNVNDQRQLWLRLDAPPLSSYSATQRFQITITATNGGI